MKTLLKSLFLLNALLLTACSKSEPSTPKIAKIASSALVEAAQNEDQFKATYLEKEVIIENLVTYATWSETDKYADGFAYNAATDTLCATGKSQIAGKPVKSNEQDFFFKLIFPNPADLAALSDSKEIKTGEDSVRDYSAPYSVAGRITELTGNSITVAGAKLLK